VDVMEEICQQHSRDILDRWTMFQYAKANGWINVMFPFGHKSISDEWLEQNIKKTYLCYGHYWYFECEKDAALFILRWK
jgi:hypothetical protein